MLQFLLIAAPAAIALTTVIRLVLLTRSGGSLADPSQTTYTVYAESGYAHADNRYEFTLKKLSGGYRCYVDRTPSYGGRSTNLGIIHNLTDIRGRYICYTRDLPYLEQAKTLCRDWSNLTQRYIETGQTFEA